MSSLTGYRGHPPMHVGISYGDPTGGLHGAVAVLAALLHRARTGGGQYIDLSQWETTIAVLPEAILEYTMNGAAPPRDGNRDPHMAPHGVFRAAGEDRWVAVASRTTPSGAASRSVIGQPGAGRRSALRHPRRAQAPRGRARGAGDGVDRDARRGARRSPTLQAAGIPAFVAATNRDLAEDPHLAARGFLVKLPHPEVGTRMHLGIPWRMSETTAACAARRPCLGEDTDDVLRDVCGYARRRHRAPARRRRPHLDPRPVSSIAAGPRAASGSRRAPAPADDAAAGR